METASKQTSSSLQSSATISPPTVFVKNPLRILSRLHLGSQRAVQRLIPPPSCVFIWGLSAGSFILLIFLTACHCEIHLLKGTCAVKDRRDLSCEWPQHYTKILPYGRGAGCSNGCIHSPFHQGKCSSCLWHDNCHQLFFQCSQTQISIYCGRWY